jgi:hypothetical protein
MRARRPVRLLTAAVAALFVAAIVAPAAGATAYTADRPSFSIRILFDRDHRRIRRFDVEAVLHCRDSSHSATVGSISERIGFPVRRNGRFRDHFGRRLLSFTLVGHVGPHKVHGRFRYFERRGACHTGRLHDPWVHFVARPG